MTGPGHAARLANIRLDVLHVSRAILQTFIEKPNSTKKLFVKKNENNETCFRNSNQNLLNLADGAEALLHGAPIVHVKRGRPVVRAIFVVFRPAKPAIEKCF